SLAASALGVVVGSEASGFARLPARTRSASYALAGLVGMAGSAFHVYNVLRRPGGLSWLNLFYSAPLFAPAALVLAASIGIAADRLPSGPSEAPAPFAGVPMGRVLCGLSAAGLAGTVAEVALLHY